MTSGEVSKHLDKMVKEEKLFTDYTNKYHYVLPSNMGRTYKGAVFSSYLMDTLVSVGLLFEDPYSLLIMSRLDDLYEAKYGSLLQYR